MGPVIITLVSNIVPPFLVQILNVRGAYSLERGDLENIFLFLFLHSILVGSASAIYLVAFLFEETNL